MELAELAKTALESAVSGAIRRILKVRADQAFDALMDELRAANVSPEEVAARDDTAAMMLKFFTTMSLGAAAENLRILARILTFKAEHPDRGADEFVMWADIIGGLQPEELLFLATMAEVFEAHESKSQEDKRRADVALEFAQAVEGKSGSLADPADVQMVGNRLVATGLVQPIPTIGGGNRFAPTKRFWRLLDMARLSKFGPEFAQQ